MSANDAPSASPDAGERSSASPVPVLRRPDSGPSDRDVFEDLFARRISQIADGTIAVVSADRQPGIGTTVTVCSRVDGIDAVAVCRGVDDRRIQDIESWFPGERVTVIAAPPTPGSVAR